MARIEDRLLTPRQTGGASGRLTVGWQMMLGIAWVAAFFAFAAVWKASEEIGIGTWWLGPRSQKQPTVVRFIPFSLCVLIIVAAMYNVRRLSIVSIIASLGVAAIAAGDIGRSGGLAAIEFGIALAVLLVSLASFTGNAPDLPADAPRSPSLAPGEPLPPPTGPPA